MRLLAHAVWNNAINLTIGINEQFLFQVLVQKLEKCKIISHLFKLVHIIQGYVNINKTVINIIMKKTTHHKLTI